MHAQHAAQPQGAAQDIGFGNAPQGGQGEVFRHGDFIARGQLIYTAVGVGMSHPPFAEFHAFRRGETASGQRVKIAHLHSYVIHCVAGRRIARIEGNDACYAVWNSKDDRAVRIGFRVMNVSKGVFIRYVIIRQEQRQELFSVIIVILVK